MKQTTDIRSDDGGGLIEYIGGTDRYFVVLMLDGIEIARRGPYRDRGNDLMVKFAEQRAKAEARMARLRSGTTNAFRRSEGGTRGVGRPTNAYLPTATNASSSLLPTPPLYPPSR